MSAEFVERLGTQWRLEIVFRHSRFSLDCPLAVLESLLAFKRAGADGILTYFAVEAARLLEEPQ